MMCTSKFFSMIVSKFIKASPIFRRQSNNASTNLVEIGHFEQKKSESNENYEPGQLFIHKLFGYRGIILFPWFAKVLEVNEINDMELNSMNYYYQVLIDCRDCSFLSNFKQFEAVTYLASSNTENRIRSIPGMGYVAHEDVIPFTPTVNQSVQHELLNKFFKQSNDQDHLRFLGNNKLKVWENKNTSLLKFLHVYKQTSEDVRITAIPFYIGYQKTNNNNSLKYWWRYQIRLESCSEYKMQLQYHYWRIFDSFGIKQTVFGKGVVGLAPYVCKKYPVFQYNSHVCLTTPKGHMWGTYILEKESEEKCICNVPLFVLESEKDDSVSPENQHL